jgi:hypothetical protein
VELRLRAIAQEGSPGDTVRYLAVVELDVHATVVLERNKLEVRFSLKQFGLHLPFWREQTVVFVSQTIAVIDNASHLHIRKGE